MRSKAVVAAFVFFAAALAFAGWARWKRVASEHAALVALDAGASSHVPAASAVSGASMGAPPPALVRPEPDGYSIDARPNTIVGRLSQTAVLGAHLGAHPQIALVHASGRSVDAPVAMNGFFAAGALEDGAWTVRCTAPGLRVAPRTVELSPAHPRADVELAATLIPRLQITVRTAFSTRPRAGQVLAREAWLDAAAIVATKGAPGDALAALPADALPLAAFLPRSKDEVAGSERVLMLDGTVPFAIEDAAWISFVIDRRVVASKPLDGAGDVLAFDLGEAELSRALGTLVVRAVDADAGLPIRGARLDVRDGPEDGGVRIGLPGDVTFSEITRVEHVLAGPLALDVGADGFERKLFALDVRPGETATLEARLAAETRVRGRLVDANGMPVDALIALSPLEEAEPFLAAASVRECRTRVDGTFVFAELPAAAWVLHPNGDRETFAPIVVDTRGETEDLTVRTARGTRVRFEALARAREGFVPGALRVVDARGLVVLERHGRAFGGDFGAGLLPGSYRARYTDSRERKVDCEFFVGAEPLTVRFE